MGLLPRLPEHSHSTMEGGGFNFDLAHRNATLGKAGMVPPSAFKTGTTICGVVYKDGVVLGADTRATGGTVVCDKNCAKIHYIAPNIYCCGAGTAADTEQTTGNISSQLELHSMNTGKEPRVCTAKTMISRMLFKYQGYVSAALVLGGVDETGASLYTIYPHGSTDKLPYVTMGSGSLAAMSVFESQYKPDMDEESAKKMVADAIRAGIFNDLGSGSNVDLCVITKGNVEMLRNYEVSNPRKFRKEYKFPKGTAPVWQDLSAAVVIEESEAVAMET